MDALSKAGHQQTTLRFQAGRDGEYWFAVGTDTVPRRPDRSTRPEKIVIVDTDLPRIDLQVSDLTRGRYSARWYASDNTLSPGTFRLSYRTDRSSQWKKVDVILPRESSREFDGEVSWMVNDYGTLYVRAEIMDRAGNVGSIVRDMPVAGTPEANAAALESPKTFGWNDSRAADNSPRPEDAYTDTPYETPQSDDIKSENFDSPEYESYEPEPSEIEPYASDAYEESAYGTPEPTETNAPSDNPNNRPAAEQITDQLEQRTPLPEAPLGDDAAQSDDWQKSSRRRRPKPRKVFSSDAQNNDQSNTNATAARPQTGATDELSDSRWRDRPAARPTQDDYPLADTTNPSSGRLTADRVYRQAKPAPSQQDLGITSEDHVTPEDYSNDALAEDAERYDADDYDTEDYSIEDYESHGGGSKENSYDDYSPETDANPLPGVDQSRQTPNDQADTPQRQVSNSKTFNLDYGLTDVDERDLARVELWITRNGGTTWAPFDTDDDKQSPFVVKVEHEGTYGFQLLIHTRNGRSARPPQPGDRPDMSIEVDNSKPTAYLTKASISPRNNRQLAIQWHASDKNLSQDGITLSYAETLNGPWVIIEQGVANSGEFLWDIPEGLPRSIHLQIDVMDQGGNRTVHQLSEPTLTQPLNPRARIRNIRVSP